MVYLVYCDNVGKKGEKVLDKILVGIKIMVIRGVVGRKILYSRVFEDELFYFMEKGIVKIFVKVIVKKVENYVKLIEDEIFKILNEN